MEIFIGCVNNQKLFYASIKKYEVQFVLLLILAIILFITKEMSSNENNNLHPINTD